MAQIHVHSFYITNASSELKFPSGNLSEDKLETVMRTAMIDDLGWFFWNINLDDVDTDYLFMAEIIDSIGVLSKY